ncbi:MAG: P83/100 family protein [Leptospiraceae bacterium]|nr:P83/100 family protein [Leptospiraceae bacterium]
MAKCIFYGLFITVAINAQKVVEEELRRKAQPIDFINYTGPSRQRDTVREVQEIGEVLAEPGRERRYLNRYRVVRVYDPNQKQKLSADIFIIEPQARVDHIRNVRLILASYLRKRFGYSQADAQTLANFATYYNAVYRGDVGYVSQRYIEEVMRYVKEENLGLARSYKDWPGKTRMLIPLSETGADPFTLADQKVIEELRKQEDKGIGEREKMLALKEKEVEKREQALSKEKKELEAEKKKTTEKKEELAQKKQELEKKKEEVAKIKDPEEKKKKEEEVKKEEQKLKKEEQALKAQEEKQAKKEEEIKQKEEKQEKRQEELKQEKEQLAQDKKEQEMKKDPEKYREELERRNRELQEKEAALKKKEDELRQKTLFGGKIYYLRSKGYGPEGRRSNDLFIIDPQSRKILVRSPYEGIAGQKYDVFADGVVVIGTNAKSGFEATAYRLVLLDKDNLQVKVQGDDNIFWRSFVEIRNDIIYAVVFEGNAYYLAKFDKNLKRLARSQEKLHEDTFVTFFEDVIYVNDAQKNIIVLKEADLSLVERIKP